MHHRFSFHKEFAEFKKRWLVLLKNLELLGVVESNLGSVVLSIFQNILDEIVSLLQFKDDVIVALNTSAKLECTKVFVLLTCHEFHDICACIDLLENFRSALVQNIDDAFSNHEDYVGDDRVLLDNGKG